MGFTKMSDLAEQYSTASKNGDLAQLKSLIKNNPDCVYHTSCWMYETAVENGQLNIIKHLLSIDADANKTHIAMGAASRGDIDILRFLVEDQKIDINREDKPILRYAGINGRKDTMKYLITHGADIKIFDQEPHYKKERILCTDILKEMQTETDIRKALRPLKTARRRPKNPKF